MNSSALKNAILLLVIVAVLAGAYMIFMGPDQRTTGQKVGDAIHELPNGLDKATDELGNDRSPGQKVGDAVRHTGDAIKENSEGK